MVATVTRKWFSPNSTIGMLFLDALFECYTMEPSKESGMLIPAGAYQVIKSPCYAHFLVETMERLGLPCITPHLQGIPGPIEWHPGNVPGQTRGCTMVGQTMQPDFIGNSDEAFVALMKKLPDEFQAVYQDAPTS